MVYQVLSLAVSNSTEQVHNALSNYPMLLSFIVGFTGFVLTWLKQQEVGPTPVEGPIKH